MKNLLILGGTGFIGKKIIQKALKNNYSVTSISLHEKNNKFLSKNVNYIYADISKIENVNKLIEKDFEFVINLSGYVNHDSFFSRDNNIIESHFMALKNILSVLRRKKLERFIHIGSSDEYGLVKSPQNEDSREMPFTTYSFSKTACTHFLQMLNKSENFPVTILRLFLTYGPGQDNNRLIPQIISSCLKKKEIVTTDGKQERDFCYIDDVVEAILLSLEIKNIEGEIFNIGSGKPIIVREIVEMIIDKIGFGKPQFGKLSIKKSENMSLYPDINKFKIISGWTPSITISVGLDRTIKYYKSKI